MDWRICVVVGAACYMAMAIQLYRLPDVPFNGRSFGFMAGVSSVVGVLATLVWFLVRL